MKYKYSLLLIFSIVAVNGYCQSSKDREANRSAWIATPFKGITGKVYDSATGKPLAARIVIQDDKGNPVNSFYEKLPGFFTKTDGSFEQRLPPGNYTITVFHGIDYTSKRDSFSVSNENGTKAEIFLQRWFALKENGWVNGDGHDHLYTDQKPDSLMLDTLKQICVAQGIDFVCAAQGWAGYNDTNWRAGYSKFNDHTFTIHYGSEMPKYRTGHTWWLGQKSTHNLFWQTMDTSYENHYFQSDKGTQWTFNTLKLPNIPDVEIVERFKKADNAIAVMAHPTSWWWQKRGSIEKYVTNAACYLSFGLLAGKLWDGEVIMGYDHDHYNYQNIWFNVLNQGYRMPALSELDGGYNRTDKFYYGSMRTYYHINGKFSIEKITDAVRKGKTFVTSGPIIITHVDGKYEPGDIVMANGKKHVLHVSAYASGDAQDVLSYVLIFRNGKIFRLWDIRDRHMRKFDGSAEIQEKERAWYIVKVYGKNAWKDTASLDVMRVSNKKTRRPSDYMEGEADVAITSPYYFWPKGTTDPAALLSNIDLTVTPPPGEGPLQDVHAAILMNGKEIKTIQFKEGRALFTMPVNALLKISAKGHQPIYRTLYLDYAPHQQLLEELSSGRWMNKYDSTVRFNPGEIPWEEFHFDETKEVLSSVKWKISLEPNERDTLWEPFERSLSSGQQGRPL